MRQSTAIASPSATEDWNCVRNASVPPMCHQSCDDWHSRRCFERTIPATIPATTTHGHGMLGWRWRGVLRRRAGPHMSSHRRSGRLRLGRRRGSGRMQRPAPSLPTALHLLLSSGRREGRTAGSTSFGARAPRARRRRAHRTCRRSGMTRSASRLARASHTWRARAGMGSRGRTS